MRHRRVRHTDVAVSELGFGSAPIGNLLAEIADEDARAAIDAAWDRGVRHFDTAPHYGLGLAERRLGDALADRRRGEFVLSTKVGRLLVPNPSPTGSDLAGGGFAVPDDLTRLDDYTADGVLRSIDASLARLRIGRIDIVYVHDPDARVEQAITETIPALVRLRDEGVIGAIGIGMNQWQAPLQIIARADIDIVMLAGRWTLADRSGAPLLDECATRGISIVAAAAFNSGILAYAWPPDDSQFDYHPASAEMLDRARSLALVCNRHGVELPQAALHFPLRHPAVASVVAGFATAEQVDAAARRLSQPVPEALWAEVDAVIAGR